MVTVIVGISAGLLGSCYLVLLAPWRGPACITKSRKTISDPSGYDFEITDTYCSAIAHTATAYIYGWKRGERERTLLFEYDPVEIAGLPTVQLSADKIVITVPKVSSIFARRQTWRGMQIDYNVGRVIYPTKETILDHK